MFPSVGPPHQRSVIGELVRELDQGVMSPKRGYKGYAWDVPSGQDVQY